MKSPNVHRCASSSILVALQFFICWCFCSTAMAQVPDFTAGGVPADTNNINLGPTGMKGWLYHQGIDSSLARQIKVTSVAVGSPADGVLAVDDVILGVDGSGATPVAFTSDARIALGMAIGDAEASSPATLKLLRWRAGVTTTVQITLQTLGAYSATAPYNCPKSAAILEQGLAHRTANEDAGNFGLGTLALLAGNDPSNPANAARQALAQTEAQSLIATQQQIDFWKSGQIDTGSKVTWSLGHRLVVLSEYYLQTSDPLVLPTIEAMAVQISNGQSHLGTMGHQLTDLNAQGAPNDAYNVGYGTINSAGMPTFLGLLLAKECGLTNPEIDPAIQRASTFYAAYTGYGAHPYGEHEPYRIAHEANGKSGLASLCFELLGDRAEDGKFYSMMATAASSEREDGHTGSYFNQLWAPLGAAAGGEEAVATYFSRISWMLDLNREWDGGFYWNRLDGSGSGERWNSFDMSTAALLTYALPLRKLHITGLGHDPARYLSSQEVADAVAADDYDVTTRTTSELVTDLGNWSPKVQFEAANEIGLRTAEHATLVPQLIAIANDTQAGESRVGACFALGEIGNGSAAADLAALLDDANHEVRYASAEALRYLPQANKLAQLTTILTAAASTGKPFFPIDEEDPMHFAHARLSMLLFYNGTAYGPKGVISGSGINGVDRNLLYPAIEAVAATPFGQARSTLQTTYTNLTHDDVLALSGTILDSIVVRAPADKMFSGGVRTGGVQAMEKYDIADGVRACMKLIEDVGGDANLQLLGSFGAGVYTVEPDPNAVGFLQSYLVTNPTGARLALDEIATDINPLPLTALKTVQLTTADDPILDLPATSTVLRVSAYDHAQGDSIYTWNKVFGPGAVTFTPNNTAAAANSTVQFDGTPGAYEFEVTMSDSRGLTESYGTVVVLVSDGSAADTTAPPATDFATPPTGTSISSITMTAQTVTDPEGNGVKYYFACTSGGGNDSGWQTSPTYTDTGLLPDTNYAYSVTVRDLSVNQNTSAASSPSAGSTLGLPTSTLSEGVFHILGSSQTPTSNVIHNVSVNGAYAGFKGQGNVGSVTVPVDQTFNGTIVDYAFIKESATPDVIQTYADGGAGRFTFGSYLPRAGTSLGNNSDMKLWTVSDPGSPAYSNPANFTSSTGVGVFDNINGSIDISGMTVGTVYFFYSGYRTMPFFSATMKDAEMVVADVPLPVFGDGDTANSTEHYVCSLNFVNNNGLDTIDWSLTSNLYNGEPHCSLKGIVLVTSTGQIAMIPNVVGLTQTAAQNSIKSAGFSVGSVLLRSSSTVPTGNVISQSPGNGSTAIKTSAVNLVVSNGLPTTPVPNVLGLEQSIAESQIVAEGLVVGNVTTVASATVSAGNVISQSPNSGSLLVFGGGVDLVVAENSPPVANDDTVTVDADSSVGITLTATDADAGDTLTYVVVAGPSNGALSGTAPNLTYTPNASYSGPDSFTFKANDGAVDSNIATIDITVTETAAPLPTIIPITSFDPSNFFSSGITAGIDFDVDSDGGTAGFQAITQAGFLSVPADASKSYNVSHNGITFDIQTTNANLANQARWRGNASAGDLVNDFQQFYGRSATPGNGVAATVTLTGLVANTDYEVSYFTYNVGAGQSTYNFYNGASTSDPLITTFTAAGNQTNYSTWAPGITFAVNSGASGTVVMTIHAPAYVSGSNYDSRLTLNGISVVDPNAPLNNVPAWVGDPVNEIDATEDAAYVSTLSDDASDADVADTLVYTKVSGPAWLTVATNGDLGGTPTNTDVGVNAFTVSVTDNVISTPLETALNITVINTNDVPVFAVDPINGSDATEDAAYAATIAGSAIDDDADASLSYAKVSGPAWLTIAANGDLSGTPTNSDVGANIFTISVTDGIAAPVNATLNITVVNTNDAPVFAADPIYGTDATEDAAYAATIAGSATDDDAGSSLSYTKVSGPVWLSVATDGTLSGMPSNSDVGVNAFTVSVSDGISAPVNAMLNIVVINTNDAPVFVADPINGSDATEDSVYAGTIASSATDVDAGASLSYAKISGPAWLTVAINGDLSGTPTNSDVGANIFTVSVSDGIAAAVNATLNITVINANDAPVFAVDPITGGDATEGAAYAGSISGSASDDDDNDTLTYAKTSGPAWLIVATDGTLSGTPGSGDVGANVFTVSVTDSIAAPVTATLNITVNAIPSTIKMVRTTITNVSSTAWTSVDLGQSYNSLVVVATPIYASGVSIPVVTRINNITATGFDLKLDRADGLTAAVSFDVSIIAVDEGVYTLANDGVKMEAVKFTSTATSRKSSWSAEARVLQNSYSNPVVVGQVMSYNDANWSAFWSMGSNFNNPVDASNFNVGKHVAEDVNTSRADETIGYIVIEAGNGTIDGVAYEAGIGSDTILGLGNSSTPYTYNLSGFLSSASAAAVSQSGMDGNDGSWAVLAGSPAISATSIGLYACEDRLKDSEQSHTSEQVAYIVFE